MSANPTRTVSTAPDATAARSSSTVNNPRRSTSRTVVDVVFPSLAQRLHGLEHVRRDAIRRLGRIDRHEDVAIAIEVEQRFGFVVEDLQPPPAHLSVRVL